MSNKKAGTGEKSPEPFRTHAETYLDMGLSIFPVNKKVPIVSWKPLQSKLVDDCMLSQWIKRHPKANIGIATGELSGVTVVDSDNPKVGLNELFSTYGETPLVVQTPSGGYHLYYRYNGEGCTRITGKKIDIKGQGGFVVAPPSYNTAKNGEYRFIDCGVWDFEELPFMIPQVESYKFFTEEEGKRNIDLFNHLRKEAVSCPTFDELYIIAGNYNNKHLKPSLEAREVKKVIKSVWGYKEANRLFQKGQQSIVLEVDKIKDWMCKYPPALVLYVDLKRCHTRKGKTFSIVSKGYDKRLGWSDSTVTKARDVLLQYGVIECVHQGGDFKGDKGKFRFE